MAYEFIASPNYTHSSMVLPAYGQKRSYQAILIHWWDNPAKQPKIDGVISHFKNPAAQVSAHYVVNNDRTVQMVAEESVAWHGKYANPFSIGIECDPNGGEAMYQRLGALVKDIRSRRGNLPLKKHSEYVQTTCPGTIDLAKIDRYATNVQGASMAKTVEEVEQEKIKEIQIRDGIIKKYEEKMAQLEKQLNAKSAGELLEAGFRKLLTEK